MSHRIGLSYSRMPCSKRHVMNKRHVTVHCTQSLYVVRSGFWFLREMPDIWKQGNRQMSRDLPWLGFPVLWSIFLSWLDYFKRVSQQYRQLSSRFVVFLLFHDEYEPIYLWELVNSGERKTKTKVWRKTRKICLSSPWCTSDWSQFT